MTTTPAQRIRVRKDIVYYTTQAESHRLNWHYSQQRPFHGYALHPSAYHVADCSAYVSLAFSWAMHESGVYLRDPLDRRYSGYGYTGSMLTTNPAPEDKYLVGDWAIWGPNYSGSTHTAICRKAGTKRTAIFSSNGHESWRFSDDAPEPLRIVDFPEHLLGVYRHPALA